MKSFNSASLLFFLGISAFCASISIAQNKEFTISNIAKFDHPWAIEFLPDDKILLTEMRGSLKLLDNKGVFLDEVKGVPEVVFGGQGGLGDIALHPAFEKNRLVYLSYAEAGPDNTSGAAVAKAKLHNNQNGFQLTGLEVILRQYPKVTGKGHFGHRLVFGPEGYLWISSGERQKFDPSQDM